MSNKYLGEFKTILLGMDCLLVYDWKAISAIHSKFGREKMANLFNNATPEEIAEIFAIGLQKHQPHITAEFIMEKSPPIVQVLAVIDQALAYAYFGPESANQEKGEGKETLEAEKKTQ